MEVLIRYWCGKCGRWHKPNSGVGMSHKTFIGEADKAPMVRLKEIEEKWAKTEKQFKGNPFADIILAVLHMERRGIQTSLSWFRWLLNDLMTEPPETIHDAIRKILCELEGVKMGQEIDYMSAFTKEEV